VSAGTAGRRPSHGRREPRHPRASTGMPKTAMTAWPMNFSTVPPWRSMTVPGRPGVKGHRARS
jgi:hypothetical protein